MSDAELFDMDDLERQLGALARSISDDDRRLVAPPPDLFAAISDELAAGTAHGRTAPPSVQSVPQPWQGRHHHPDHGATGAGSSAGPRPQPPATPVTDLGSERRRRRAPTLWAGLSAAAALAVLAVSALYLAGLTGGGQGETTTLASATIVNDELPVGSDSTAEARLVDVDGDLRLDVAFDDGDGLPADIDGFYEVWLIDENVDGMISLGVLTADGRIDVPDNLDPAAFPVVDISVEPLDGDPTHSGQSILRGVLA